MKRHPSFISLSKEHHEGLLLAIRLQQGDSALERLWSHDPRWQAEYIVKFFHSNLTSHFEAEEVILFPFVLESFPARSDLIQRLHNEHEKMRSMVEKFTKPDVDLLEEQLNKFGALLEGHIRCEERELFPFLELHASDETLQQIGEQLENYHRQRNESPNK